MNERIKELRKMLHLTQAEFGTAVGVSFAAISKIETGGNNPSTALVKLICSTYHVNYLWLTEGVGPVFEVDDIDAIIDQRFAGADDFTRSIFKAFCRLPDESWIALRDIIDDIKKRGL